MKKLCINGAPTYEVIKENIELILKRYPVDWEIKKLLTPNGFTNYLEGKFHGRGFYRHFEGWFEFFYENPDISKGFRDYLLVSCSKSKFDEPVNGSTTFSSLEDFYESFEQWVSALGYNPKHWVVEDEEEEGSFCRKITFKSPNAPKDHPGLTYTYYSSNKDDMDKFEKLLYGVLTMEDETSFFQDNILLKKEEN